MYVQQFKYTTIVAEDVEFRNMQRKKAKKGHELFEGG